MRPQNIANALKSLIPVAQPVFIWGPPGVGKSQVVAQVASDMGVELVDIRAVLLDPVDLRGLPTIKDGISHWCPPSFLPQSGRGVLFLDELNAAPPLVQAACYQLVLDRKVGEYELPEGWTVVAAGNRETDRALTHRMPSALANRFIHLDFEVHVEDWLVWAETQDFREELTAFIRFRPNLLHGFDPQGSEKAFPSPRSWEFVGRVLGGNPAPDIEYDLVRGAVGEGAAAEFAGFCKVFRELPDPDRILSEPMTSNVPEDPATIYALCEVLAKRAAKDTAESIITYASRLPSEFSVLLVRDSIRADRALMDSPAFSRWAEDNSAVLF